MNDSAKKVFFLIGLSAFRVDSKASDKIVKKNSIKSLKKFCYVSFAKAQGRSLLFKQATDQMNGLFSELKSLEQEAMVMQSDTTLSEVEKRQKMEKLQYKFAEIYQRVELAKRALEERKEIALQEFSSEVFSIGYSKWVVLENPYENWNPALLNEEADDLTDRLVKALDKAFKGFFIPKSQSPKISKN